MGEEHNDSSEGAPELEVVETTTETKGLAKGTRIVSRYEEVPCEQCLAPFVRAATAKVRRRFCSVVCSNRRNAADPGIREKMAAAMRGKDPSPAMRAAFARRRTVRDRDYTCELCGCTFVRRRGPRLMRIPRFCSVSCSSKRPRKAKQGP